MDEDDRSVTTLVAAAAAGNQDAWNEIVARYSPLLVGIARQSRLSAAEVEDVAQTVWLRLVEHLADLREARALPMWIITTSRRESWRLVSTERRTTTVAALPEAGPVAPEPPPEQSVLEAERHEVLLTALAELEPRQRELLGLLMQDPPLSYAEISRRTGIAVGGIGPTRARAIERLRRTTAVRAFMSAGSDRLDSAGN